MSVTAEPATATTAPDAGVIEEARRRQRRQRIGGIAAAGVIGAVLALVLVLSGAGQHVPGMRLSSSLRWLTGPSLSGQSDLRLVVSENTGPAFIVDVDSGLSQPVAGLGVPSRERQWSPTLYPLSAASGGALAVVTKQACASCAVSKTDFLIGANGSVRRTATVTLARDQRTVASALGSVSGTWVLTWPASGHCTARLEPGEHTPLAVPCGSLNADTSAGLMISRGSQAMLIDPQTGHVRARVAVHGQLDVLSSTLALTSTAPEYPTDGSYPTDLTLVNLTDGARTHLRWPSTLHFGYRVFPDPDGPLVAVEFADPAYPEGQPTIGQAADIWLLNARNGSFTHVPVFPILEALKFSGITWTSDGRLVIVAQGGALGVNTRTVVGLWRPGQHTIHIRRLPTLNGYSQIVALSG